MMFLTIGLTRFFQQQTETNFFCQAAFAFFLEAACRFTTTSWTRRMFLEFCEKFEKIVNVLW